MQRCETSNPKVVSQLCPKGQVGVNQAECRNEVEGVLEAGEQHFEIKRSERAQLDGETES